MNIRPPALPFSRRYRCRHPGSLLWLTLTGFPWPVAAQVPQSLPVPPSALPAAADVMQPSGAKLALAPLTLETATRWLLARNRNLQAARIALDNATAGLDVAGARPNPTVTFGVSNVDTQAGLRPGYSRIAAISQPLERGDKRDLRLAAAHAAQQAAQASLLDVTRNEQLRLQEAYWELKLAQERQLRAEESARLAREMLDKAELRLRAGDIASSEVARIRTDAVRVEAEARLARSDLMRAQLALAQVLASEALAPRLQAVEPWPVLTETRLPADPEDPLATRPDVQVARQQLRQAEEILKLAQAQQRRDVTLGAQYELDTYNNRRLGSVSISFPLFTGYDYRGEITQAMLQRDSARAGLARTEAAALSEIALARQLWQLAHERADRLQQEGLPAARKAFASAKLAFEQGAVSALEVMDARRTLLAAELDAASAQAEAAKATARLQAALYRSTNP